MIQAIFHSKFTHFNQAREEGSKKEGFNQSQWLGRENEL